MEEASVSSKERLSLQSSRLHDFSISCFHSYRPGHSINFSVQCVKPDHATPSSIYVLQVCTDRNVSLACNEDFDPVAMALYKIPVNFLYYPFCICDNDMSVSDLLSNDPHQNHEVFSASLLWFPRDLSVFVTSVLFSHVHWLNRCRRFYCRT